MYIEKRRRQYYALHDIPADVQDKLGYGRRYCVPLKTDHRPTAENRKKFHEMQLLREIAAARRDDPTAPDKDALYWRDQLRDAKDQDERDLLLGFIQDEAHERQAKAARLNGTYNIHELPEDPATTRFENIALGKLVSLTENLDDWLLTLDGRAKSIDQKRSTVNRFAAKFPHVQDVSHKAVQLWVNDLAKEEGKKRDTIRRFLSELRGYWDHLIKLEVVAEGIRPFDRVSVPKVARDATGTGRRKAFTAEQIVRLLAEAEAHQNPALADLIRMAMWTGARIEELCALKVEHVHDGWFEIVDAKTKAGQRSVPVHSKLRPVMKRLIGQRNSGFVLENLPSSNKYQKRSHGIGHAFSRLKTDLGYGPEHVFHSIRKTVATLLQNAEVSEVVAANILGHKIRTMTYGVYSAGSYVKQMQSAIEKIKYPATPKRVAPTAR